MRRNREKDGKGDLARVWFLPLIPLSLFMEKEDYLLLTFRDVFEGNWGGVSHYWTLLKKEKISNTTIRRKKYYKKVKKTLHVSF